MDIKKKVEDIFDIAAQPTVDIVSSIFLDGVVGSVLPGVTGAMLAYKQKRSEKMLEKFMIETQKRHEELENKLLNASEDRVKEISGKYFGIVADYAIDEVQEDKIQYLVNGFINLASADDLNEDFVLTYYDTLKTLRLVDIGVLKLYYEIYLGNDQKSYTDILNEFNIDYDQYNAIRDKLERLGLFATKRSKYEDILYENIINIQSYLQDVYKGKKATLRSLRTIEKRDSFLISKFGKEFTDFFIKSK